MPRHRIFCATTITSDTSLDLPADAARHVAQVLRLKTNDSITLFDGSGCEFEGRLTKIGKITASVAVGAAHKSDSESPLTISLWHGICRGQRMDNVVQKSTELGVSCIQPMFTARCGVKLDTNRSLKRLDHWQKVAISAAEQSRRCRIPQIVEPMNITDLLTNRGGNATRIIFDPSGQHGLAEVLQKNLPVILCTGPEGGFTDDELAQAESAGFSRVSLGPRILRTETAPIVALSLVQHLAGDLGIVNPAF